jgi:hypothetical protein
VSNFQARYAIRHAWAGAIDCFGPKRGVWGGPPSGVSGNTGPVAARDLAFAPRGAIQLAALVRHDVPEIGLTAAGAKTVSWPGTVPPGGGGCGACGVGLAEGAAAGLGGIAMGLTAAIARRRRRGA